MKFNFYLRLLTIAGCCGFTSISLAQEEPVEPPTSSGQQVEMAVIAGDELGGTPMIFSTVTDSSGDGAPQMQFMTGMPGGAGGFSIGGPEMVSMGAPDSFSMLSDPSVQKDLELVGDQLTQLQDLQKSFGAKMKEQMGDISKGKFDPERMKGLGELAKRLKEEQQSKMKDLLLPHQVDRLKQISVQRHMEMAGTAGALASDKLAEELGITDEQKERLKKRSQEITTEMQAKMEKVKDEAKEQLLQELTADQRAKLKALTGEKFKSNPQDWSEKFQGLRRPRTETKTKAAK